MKWFFDSFAFISRLAAIPVVATLLFFNFFSVPSGFVGVLEKKIKTKESATILESGTHWQWSGFIPELWSFRLVPQETQKTVVPFRVPLRYSSYFSSLGNFEVKGAVEVVYQVKNILPYAKKFANENQHFQSISNSKKVDLFVKKLWQQQLQRTILQKYQNEEDLRNLENSFKSYLEDKVAVQRDWDKTDLAKYFSFNNLEIERFEMPPLELYYQQSSVFKNYLAEETQKSFKELHEEKQFLRQQEYRQSAWQEKLAQLREMGELIRENPYILEYMKIEKLNPDASVIILDNNQKLNLNVNSSTDFSFSQEETVTQLENKSLKNTDKNIP